MIRPITEPQAKALRAWMLDESCQVFLGLFLAEAKRIEGEAVEEMMAKPVEVIELENPTIGVQDAFKEAARLRLFIEQFKEWAGKDFTSLTYARRDDAAAASPAAPDSAAGQS